MTELPPAGADFADMVSKSTNYCGATRADPTAVLVLCDVACGAQYELIASQYEAAENSTAQKKVAFTLTLTLTLALTLTPALALALTLTLTPCPPDPLTL